MQALMQEFERLEEELKETVLLYKRACEGREGEREKALAAAEKVKILRREKSISVNTLDPVEAILAGKDPDYNTFDKVKKVIAQHEELATIHEEMRSALNNKAGELYGEKEAIKGKMQDCRREIIKKAGLKLLNKTDKQLVFNLLLAVGLWSGQPLIKYLEPVPGFLSGKNWGLVHEAAVKDLLKKSGAMAAL